MLIGYARCSTDRQDLIARRKALRQLGVDNEQIYLDRGLAGKPPRPGLEKALGAVGRGDTLVVASLGRLARSMRDARSIGEARAAACAPSAAARGSPSPRHPRSLCAARRLGRC
jgi:DNA invertase Pin-like site-specific DNA recombinase